MDSKAALHDISIKANAAADFASFDDKDELEKLEHLTEAMRDIVDILYQYESDNPNGTVFIEEEEVKVYEFLFGFRHKAVKGGIKLGDHYIRKGYLEVFRGSGFTEDDYKVIMSTDPEIQKHIDD